MRNPTTALRFLRLLCGMVGPLALGLAWLPGAAAAELPLAGVTELAVGHRHACVKTSSGGAWCWGWNGSGAIGDGTTANRTAAVAVEGLGQGVAAIAAGAAHSCAVMVAGGVKCWGANASGQLGDGTTTPRPLPTDVVGLGGRAVGIAAGDATTCVVLESGAAKCWGENQHGQVGDGSSGNDRLAPVAVSGLGSGVAAVTVGNNHSCALLASGSARCWGRNDSGQLGDGTTTDRATPTPVSGLSSGVSVVSAGYGTSCAVVGGAARCWGNNYEGQVGDGTDTDRPTPTAVVGLGSGVSHISAGYYHSCAVGSGGSVRCWGYNDSGELGNGTRTVWEPNPVAVSGLGSGATAVGAGGEFSCASVAGSVRCWGWNNDGELGAGAAVPGVALAPRAVAGGDVFSAVDGETQTCGVTRLGAAKCWGDNDCGQLGDGTKVDRPAPVGVTGLGSGVSRIVTGFEHSCALTSATGVRCWGENGYGQLGDGTRTDRTTPVDVTALTGGVTAVAAGDSHNCAVQMGAAKCWGDNLLGQLGDGTTTTRTTPVGVVGLGSGVVGVAAGERHSCAVTSGGAAKCWGHNSDGQLGDGTTTDRLTPVAVTGLGSGVVALATSGYHTCALLQGGAVKCWGDNQSGQLGDGSKQSRAAPVDVVGLGGAAVGIAAGVWHTCATLQGGGVKCWGYNEYGQLGDGTQVDRTNPVAVTGLAAGVVAIAAGLRHSCAVLDTGEARCWGSNGWGELGVGELGYSPIPVTVLANVAPSCAPTISPATATATASGGQGTVTVTVAAGCTWTATSNAAWLSIVSGASGTGGGGVTYAVATNAEQAARTGSLTIAGQTFTVTQDAAPTPVPGGSWSNAASLRTARYLHTATLLVSGKVLVAGGTDGTSALGSVELYTRPTNTWSVVRALTTPRLGHTATLLGNGKLLVAGGQTGPAGSSLASAELYDPTTDTWSAAGTLANARTRHAATLLASGKVLVTGGEAGGQPLAGAELYDPVTNTWSGAAWMTTARSQHTATLLAGGKVLVSGGTGAAVGGAELYDAVANAWGAAGTMGTARGAHVAAMLASGAVVVAGGQAPGQSGGLASSERYDPAANAWTGGGTLASGRFDHTGTLLPNDRLLVAGGTGNGTTALGTAELYDPAANAWSGAGAMGSARRLHTATLLGDGRVLVVGGLGANALSASEIFDPSIPGEPSAQPVLAALGSCATDFYIAEAALAAGAKEGYWGMEVLLTRSPRQLMGGFNLGGGFDGDGRNPGFGAFALSFAQRVTMTINAQPLAGPIALQVDLLKDNVTRVGGVQGTPTAAAPLSFSADLSAGFYVVRIGSMAGSGRGTFQLQLATPGSFADGVVVGGFLPRDAAGASMTGFGAFCVPQTQPVKVRVFGSSLYGANAVGGLVLTLRDSQRNVVGVYE